MGQAKKAGMAFGGAREGSSLVAEEDVVGSFPLKAAGVLGDEGTFRARTALMQSTGDQLFARAAFAANQYRVGSPCSTGDRVTDVVDSVTRPDEAKIRGAGDRVANLVEAEGERASDGQDDAAVYLSWTELTHAIEPHSVDANVGVAGS